MSSIERSNQNWTQNPGSPGKRKETRTSTIHLHQTTTSTPAQYVAGLTDFLPGHSKLFGNSADEYLKGLGAFMRAVTELFGPEQAGRGLGR